MNTKEYTELFKSFLIENDAYEQFIHNLHVDLNLTFQQYEQHLISYSAQPRYYLMRAFTFSLTDEGFDYWSALSHKWNKRIILYLKKK